MENKEKTIVLLAEEVAIDEKRSNDIFLLISFKLFDNKGNRNGEGVTAAFISEIMNHRDKYAALPIYADVPALLGKDYNGLGHKYDPETGRFGTAQIGGLVDFKMSVTDGGVVSLYAEARIPKREAEVCERLQELYVRGGLNVSFEVKYNPDNTIEKDGVRFVDAGDGNTLTGMCIVSVPACPDANALDMVAEVNAEETTETNEVKEEVPNEELNNPEVIEAQAETAPETVEAPAEEVAQAEVSEAEVIKEGGSVYESYSKCPETGETIHEVYETREMVETVEAEPAPAPEAVVAEEDPRDTRIAELENELASVKAELQAFKDAKAAEELAAKRCRAQAFAEKQGLDVADEAVAKAIAELDYEMIAELAMKEAEEAAPVVAPEVSMASFVDMEISNEEYGGLLTRTANN